ncbi:hypothetical protein B4129_1889 [Bacillus safensis]|nr:hypothetical protein B4107_1808 [Bacillus safensis]KIL16915.1 hypothetical protein B4129_1889 [Bacillus safensis]
MKTFTHSENIFTESYEILSLEKRKKVKPIDLYLHLKSCY